MIKQPASQDVTKTISQMVGERMRMRREELALPVVEVAALLQVSVNALVDIEAGRRSLEAPTLFLSAQVLQVEPNYFFEGLTQAVISDSVRIDNTSCEC